MNPATPECDSDDATTRPISSSETQPLPRLSERPVAYPGCCLALSTPLVAYLHSLLPLPPALALSIGSGFGLLEAHLLVLPRPPHIVGVEVEPNPNRYLPAERHRAVHGSRFLEPLAGEAATWLFVYPRRVGLMREYLDAYRNCSVSQIIWAGPQVDWDDYKDHFEGWDVQAQSADKVGGRPWELIAVARRVTCSHNNSMA